MNGLTAIQASVLGAIKDGIRRTGRAPRISDIARGRGTSRQAVYLIVRALEKKGYLNRRRARMATLERTAAMTLTSGIDVGAGAVKVAVVQVCGAEERVLARYLERIRRRDIAEVVEESMAAALRAAGVARNSLDYVATTGEGDSIPWRTGHFYGITSHARGALFLDPEARGAIDAGALHARAIRFDERGRVLGYRMTSQCASGSGQFLENIARYLGVSLEDVGRLSRLAVAPEKISSICAVLAETDVINMVSRGVSTPDILRGIHDSMALRLAGLLRATQIQGPVLLTGGLAADEGLLAALRDRVADGGAAVDVRNHTDSVYAGAIGAALWGAYRHAKLARSGDHARA